MADLLGFTWYYPNDGFEWVSGIPVNRSQQIISSRNGQDSTEAMYLAAVDRYPHFGDDFSQRTTTYNSLHKRYENLFQTFADTKPTLQGILEFANQYGRLGENSTYVKVTKMLPKMQELRANEKPDPTVTHLQYVDEYPLTEPYETWVQHINELHLAVEVWGLLLKRDETNLRRYVTWYNKLVQLHNPYTDEVYLHQFLDWLQKSAGQQALQQGEILRPARLLLNSFVTDRL